MKKLHRIGYPIISKKNVEYVKNSLNTFYKEPVLTDFHVISDSQIDNNEIILKNDELWYDAYNDRYLICYEEAGSVIVEFLKEIA